MVMTTTTRKKVMKTQIFLLTAANTSMRARTSSPVWNGRTDESCPLRTEGGSLVHYALKMQRMKLYISGVTVLLSCPPPGTERKIFSVPCAVKRSAYCFG